MPMKFTVSGGNRNAEILLTEKKKGDIAFLTVTLRLPAPEIPEAFRISWSVSAKNCASTWNPSLSDIRGLYTDWGKVKIQSRLASWMPIQQLISHSGHNQLLIAVSDVDTPVSIQTGIREEDATVSCAVEFFTRPTAPTDQYTAVIRLDKRPIPYYDSIYDTASWWETDCGYQAATVPQSAEMPMDSLWYSFHQQLDRDEILKECRASRELGLETVIIDDGWQTDDNARGYAYCGDWQVAPKKMGDMASLVEEIHHIGMKVMLWYSVPFMGVHASRYKEFKDMLLDESGNKNDFFALDPRYPQVRDYLVNTYKTAVREWRLDGLKLDFIDSFSLRGKSLLYDEKRDTQSLEEAIHALMSECKTALTAINPDIMIEFRQSYVGPSIRKYGNMLRVGDCPCDSLRNRVGVINLRLTSGKTPVHSDMLMWNTEDKPENAAMQFVSILYSVPQISVRVDKLPENHLKMLRFYLSFWKEWKEVLLHGKLTAENPEYHYSTACSTLGDKSVITAYTNPILTIQTKETAAVNATAQQTLFVKDGNGRTYSVVNCMGEELAKGVLQSDLAEIAVPTAGILFVQ